MDLFTDTSFWKFCLAHKRPKIVQILAHAHVQKKGMEAKWVQKGKRASLNMKYATKYDRIRPKRSSKSSRVKSLIKVSQTHVSVYESKVEWCDSSDS